MSDVLEVAVGDPGYPEALLNLRRCDQPTLYCVGDPAAVARVSEGPAVTIVGARRASAYGLRVAEAIARDLAAAGIPIVSGMALGIDSAAHRGALSAGATTVAVVPGGPDRVSPPSNRALYERIIAAGAVISEHRPGARIEPFHFAHRNRIMAALAEVVVIVEAAQPSGTLVTVERALELGRTIGAVPGQVGVRVAEGTNALIKDGAALIRDARDVLDLLYGIGVEPPDVGREADQEFRLRTVPVPRPGPPLEDDLLTVLDSVAAGVATVDALVVAGGIGSREAAVALARLELLGYVRADALGAYSVTGLPTPE